MFRCRFYLVLPIKVKTKAWAQNLRATCLCGSIQKLYFNTVSVRYLLLFISNFLLILSVSSLPEIEAKTVIETSSKTGLNVGKLHGQVFKGIDCLLKLQFHWLCFLRLHSPDELFSRIAQDLLGEISTGTKPGCFSRFVCSNMGSVRSKPSPSLKVNHFVKVKVMRTYREYKVRLNKQGRG